MLKFKVWVQLLVVVVVLLYVNAAFAVTGDTTKPLFGWNPETLNFILPLLVPFLVSLFSKSGWPVGLKRGVLGALCVIATAAVGWFGGYIVKTDLTTINIVATFAIVFGVSNLLYQLLANKVFKPITENVGNTEKKIALPK